ncbi:MAG TPA: GNAT family N-acetyltransferase [Rubrivivax sp.]|nr:GNAT family N-acetyltransferase [Rubrivivax sp.]
MPSPPLEFRRATRDDLPAIVAMLADDPLGALREANTSPLPRCYHDAFDAIDRDPNIELVVVQAGGSGALGISKVPGVLGVLQMSFIPNISHRGGWRALIEGVRVAAESRSGGVGRQMLLWAVERARQRGCLMVQLTSDKTRTDAIRFYEGLGFVASHEGMKLHLPRGDGGDG